MSKNHLRSTTCFKGDAAEYTGKTVQRFGKTFYEVQITEGRNKGDLRVVAQAPGADDVTEAPAPEAATDAAMPDDGGWTDEALREVNEQPEPPLGEYEQPAAKEARKRAPKAAPTKPEKAPRQNLRARDLGPGVVLRRTFKGEEIIVTCTSEGMFEWRGTHFKSISACAKAITGYGISGPVFFGLDVDGSK